MAVRTETFLELASTSRVSFRPDEHLDFDLVEFQELEQAMLNWDEVRLGFE